MTIFSGLAILNDEVALCHGERRRDAKIVHVILMGAQGSGKGTQAALLGPQLKLEKIATGDLFRTEIASGSRLGVELKGILGRGDLVPDELTNGIVRDRIGALVTRRAAGEDVAGALFDGFPRTDVQAQALDGILDGHGESVTTVIEIDVPRDVLVARLSGRRVCVECGRVYHAESDPARIEGSCDACGGRVIQRDDDKPEAIERRLALYDQLTAPLIDYYDGQGKLTRIDGDRSVDAVQESILAVVKLRLTGTGLG